MNEIKETLEEFTNEMERILKKHNYKSSWDGCDLNYLQDKLVEEIIEYFMADSFSKNESKSVLDLIHRIMVGKEQIKVQRQKEPKLELIDIANVCMMIWDQLTKQDEKTKQETYMKD